MELATALKEQISLIGDMERIASRIAAQRITPRELIHLKNSLQAIEIIKAIMESTDYEPLHTIAQNIDPLAGAACAGLSIILFFALGHIILFG